MVEDAVGHVEPAVRAPGEAIEEFVAVVGVEAGEEDFAGVGVVVVIGVAQEK